MFTYASEERTVSIFRVGEAGGQVLSSKASVNIYQAKQSHTERNNLQTADLRYPFAQNIAVYILHSVTVTACHTKLRLRVSTMMKLQLQSS
jgi:hypothetical protein